MSFLLFSLFPIFIKTSENSASFAYKYTSRVWFTFSTLTTSFFQDISFFLRLNHCLGTLASSLFQLLLTITYKVAIIGLTICNLRGLLSICQTYQTSSCIKVLELAWRFFITAYIIPDFSWNHHQINLCKLVYVFCPRKLRNVLWNMKKYTS